MTILWYNWGHYRAVEDRSILMPALLMAFRSPELTSLPRYHTPPASLSLLISHQIYCADSQPIFPYFHTICFSTFFYFLSLNTVSFPRDLWRTQSRTSGGWSGSSEWRWWWWSPISWSRGRRSASSIGRRLAARCTGWWTWWSCRRVFRYSWGPPPSVIVIGPDLQIRWDCIISRYRNHL